MKPGFDEKTDIHPKGVMESTKRSNGRVLVIVIATSVITALVVVALGSLAMFGSKLVAQSSDNAGKEIFFLQISDDPSSGRVHVDKSSQVIVTESPRIGNSDHSVTLQDFKKGFQAVKDVERKQCFIFPTSASYTEMEKAMNDSVTQGSKGETENVNKLALKEPIPSDYIDRIVGHHIASFCSGLDSFWLVDEPKGEQRVRRGNGDKKKKVKVKVKVKIVIN